VTVTTATSGPRQRRIPPEVPVKTKWSRWLLGVLGLVLVGSIASALARHWPYSEAQVVPGLQDTFKTTVTIGEFRRFYFPHPGCELEMVRLERPTKVGREKPLATVQKIRITGRYSDLLFRPYHLARIEVIDCAFEYRRQGSQRTGMKVQTRTTRVREFRWEG